jgi:hypothetical protein
MPTEKFANSATTTLGSPMTDTDLTLTVTTTSGFPTTPKFRVKIDNEIIMVTANVTTLTWTIQRGLESTIPAAHSSGAIVSQILTADGINHISGYVETGLAGQLPAPERDGRLYLATDSPLMFRDSGNQWRAWYMGIPVKVPPSVSTFLPVNVYAGVTALDTPAGIYLKWPNDGGEVMHHYVVPRPGAAYTLTVGFHHCLSYNNYSYVGCVSYNNGSTRSEHIQYFNIQEGFNFEIRRSNTPTSFAQDLEYRNTSGLNPLFMRIHNNGLGTKTYYFSHNNTDFELLGTHTEASWVAETHVGFTVAVINNPSLYPTATLIHWDLQNS